MADKTGISWTDATWNPTTGCDKVSPGCDHCYAMTLAKRLQAMGSPRYQNDGDPATSGPGFGFTMHPDALDQPLRWTRPRRIFVNSMSDLFHSQMTTGFLAEVWAVMSMAPQHTFQVLTKRPGVMASVLTRNVSPGNGLSMPFKMMVDEARLRRGVSVLPDSRRDDGTYAWPLPNVWLGTSVEDQKRADLRIPHLLRTPAAVRFLSCEPLLGPVDLQVSARVGWRQARHGWVNDLLHWVIVGGESGRGARPMHPDWARSLRDQCQDAGVTFFMKQTGAVLAQEWSLSRRKGDDPTEWPETFPQEYPDAP